MNPPWWGIPVILALGAALVALAWWRDRRNARDAAAAAREAPDLPVAGPAADLRPTYVTEDDLVRTASAPTPDADALLARRGEASGLAGGTPDAAFLTEPGRGFALLIDPLVLVTDAPLQDERALLPVLSRARAEGRGLVIVAPGFSAGALGTLRANALTGRVVCLPVLVAEGLDLRRAVALTGGRPVPAADLASGYLPADSWGRCAAWVADADNSWIFLAP